uniref:Uncharacterized protein n=1 Tax=viral metagenome TaxID=1070528 RepID=A0A6C0BLI2_9ZZZZ
MTTIQIVNSATMVANRLEFDRVCALLYKAQDILIKVKEKIASLRGNFATMLEILPAYLDQISVEQTAYYDSQVFAFLQAVSMLINLRDATGIAYIKPVAVNSTSNAITVTIGYPQDNVSETLVTVDNISINLTTWEIAIGTYSINALHAAEIQTANTTEEEQAAGTFTQSEFITGITTEIQKLVYITALICRNEQNIAASLRYITQLKGLSL